MEKTMSENLKMEDLVEKVVPTSETTEQVETKVEVETETEVKTEQDPLKTELERVKKSGRSELDKAQFSLKKNAERVKELGGDPNAILGIEKETTENYDEDDKPVTVGMLKKLQQESASKTAFQQADDIQNETERELVKYHLQNTIRSTGLPQEDLKLARALVNAVKNTQIIEESTRKTPAKSHSNSSGVDAKQEQTIVYTSNELQMMQAPFNLSPKDILQARAGKSTKFSFKK